MFFNFAKYITHKLQKVCWNADHTAPPMSQSATAADKDGVEEDEEGSQHWPNAADDNNGLSSPGEKEEDDVDMTVSFFFLFRFLFSLLYFRIQIIGRV